MTTPMIDDAICIFYDDVPRSVRAAMLFPTEKEKAALLVGWLLAKEASATWAPDRLAAIARNAADFADIKDEARAREEAGQAAGEVIKVLFSLLADDSLGKVASIESAIVVVENETDKAGGSIGHASLREYLVRLRPALHLWGAWSLANRSWPVTPDNAGILVEHAEAMLGVLVKWNLGRPIPSQYLSGPFLRRYSGWQPRGIKWRAPRLGPTVDRPVRRPAGRPKSPPAKTG